MSASFFCISLTYCVWIWICIITWHFTFDWETRCNSTNLVFFSSALSLSLCYDNWWLWLFPFIHRKSMVSIRCYNKPYTPQPHRHTHYNQMRSVHGHTHLTVRRKKKPPALIKNQWILFSCPAWRLLNIFHLAHDRSKTILLFVLWILHKQIHVSRTSDRQDSLDYKWILSVAMRSSFCTQSNRVSFWMSLATM